MLLLCNKRKVYEKTTKLNFITFSALAQQISVPEWSFLTGQDTFIIIRCLRAWCALIENSEDYREDDGEMIQLEGDAINCKLLAVIHRSDILALT